MRKIESILHGSIQGRIWMPETMCSKEVSLNLTWERYRTGLGFRKIIDALLRDGDFQSTKLADDSCIEVRLIVSNGNRSRTSRRWFPIRMFKSIQDLTEPAIINDHIPEGELV